MKINLLLNKMANILHIAALVFIKFTKLLWIYYRMEGNFGGGNIDEFGESSVIRQTKTIQISTYN